MNLPINGRTEIWGEDPLPEKREWFNPPIYIKSDNPVLKTSYIPRQSIVVVDRGDGYQDVPMKASFLQVVQTCDGGQKLVEGTYLEEVVIIFDRLGAVIARLPASFDAIQDGNTYKRKPITEAQMNELIQHIWRTYDRNFLMKGTCKDANALVLRPVPDWSDGPEQAEKHAKIEYLKESGRRMTVYYDWLKERLGRGRQTLELPIFHLGYYAFPMGDNTKPQENIATHRTLVHGVENGDFLKFEFFAKEKYLNDKDYKTKLAQGKSDEYTPVVVFHSVMEKDGNLEVVDDPIWNTVEFCEPK